MWAFDESVRQEGYDLVAGVDEAGRGCLAGPVVAAAVVLPRDFRDDRIYDSKQLSARMREVLFDVIAANAASYGIGVVSCQTIDSINILRAALLAMVQAIEALGKRPDIVLVDGNQAMPTALQQMTVKKGDAKSLSIASASIIAKVHRDRLMYELDARHPGYGFASNKGYGSKPHLDALMELGPCAVHRRSFAPVAAALQLNTGLFGKAQKSPQQ
ncbi:MAG: ribonuclease HII [Candidatus Coatesbacteria bacterium]|nr:ribonuclease HII [Candidatus Coatesbacteria bacterium]